MSRHLLRSALNNWVHTFSSLAVSESYTFAAGSLAGEVERLSSDGDTTLTVNGESLPVEATILSGPQTIAMDTNYGDATNDDRMTVVRVDGNLIIAATRTVSVAARKLGLCIFVDGDLTVNGTISMTAKGANHSAATGSNIAAFALQCIADIGADGIVPAAGGAGGAGVSGGANGNNGSAGTNGGMGGGGGGGGQGSGGGGDGRAGTLFTGGSGGGSAVSTAAPDASIDGGPGGNAASTQSVYCGGGAGNPGGLGYSSVGPVAAGDGQAGTGGLLIIICTGSITIGAAGVIAANGANGGRSQNAQWGNSGAGSGGGSVSIYHIGTYTNGGSVTANGGAYGTPFYNYHGGNGGAGDIRTVQL